MTTQSLPLPVFPPGTSRYTQAMAKCLGQVSARASQLDRSVIHQLVNLVQGRMLEYLADRICRDFDIRDEQSRFQIVTALLGIFSDEFFALFRSKIDFKPALAVSLARRIIRLESRAEKPADAVNPARRASDRLYPAIFRKYFEYRNLGDLQRLVESDMEIQKIVLLALLKQRLQARPGYAKVVDLLKQDREGFITAMFMDYLKQDRLEQLTELVESGSWQQAVQAAKEHMSQLQGDS